MDYLLQLPFSSEPCPSGMCVDGAYEVLTAAARPASATLGYSLEDYKQPGHLTSFCLASASLTEFQLTQSRIIIIIIYVWCFGVCIWNIMIKVLLLFMCGISMYMEYNDKSDLFIVSR